MHRRFVLCCFVVISVSVFIQDSVAAASDEDGTSPPPLFSGGNFNLTKKSFKKALEANPLLLVGFSATSCRHCVAFEPEYINATKLIAEFKVPFARMDLDKYKDIAETYGISSLPSLKLFRKGKPFHYEGVHNAEAIKMYVEKQVLPAVRKVGSKERLDAMKTAADVVVMGFFGDLEDEEEEYNEFKEAAELMWTRHNVYFGEVVKPTVTGLAKTWKWIARTPSVVLFQNFDMNNEGEERIEPESHTVLLTELSEMRLVDWISKNSVQVVAEITPSNFQYYEDLKLPMLMLFINKSDSVQQKQNIAMLSQFRAAAHDFRGKISFVFSDVNQIRDQRLSLGLLPHVVPSMAFNTLDANLYPFPHTKTLNTKNIRDFARDYLKGELKPKSKSADAPYPQQGFVKEVIGKTFNEIVMDDKKDVMLLLYASSDPDTETMMMYYKKVAEAFNKRKTETIVIARMDLETNQLAVQVSIHKLPAVLFFPAKDKNVPIRMYHGKGKVRPLMLWAAEVASFDLHFENDTPDLDAEQRVAYEEQLAELNERKKKEKEEKDRVKKMKEDWKKEQARDVEEEEEEEDATNKNKKSSEKEQKKEELQLVWGKQQEDAHAAEEELVNEEEIMPVMKKKTKSKKEPVTLEKAKSIPWAQDEAVEKVPIKNRYKEL